MLDFVRHRYWYFLLSLLLIIPGLVSLFIPPGLAWGIEFSSGTTMTLSFKNPVEQAELRQELATLGHADAIIQRTSGGDFLVRTRPLRPEEKDAQGQVVKPSEKQEIETALAARFGVLESKNFTTVLPIVSGEIVRNAAIAVAAACVGILLYITWAFRRVPSSFRYGTCAVIALAHDAAVVIGGYSLLGRVTSVEVNSMFITAVLTVLGFSVHDTIVVFDRIRENLSKGISPDFVTTVNCSLTETVGRSLTTSLTLIFTGLALLVFGGPTIRNFLLALLIGVTTGTYSSIFIAAQLLVVWERGEIGRWFRRRPATETAARPAR